MFHVIQNEMLCYGHMQTKAKRGWVMQPHKEGAVIAIAAFYLLQREP